MLAFSSTEFETKESAMGQPHFNRLACESSGSSPCESAAGLGHPGSKSSEADPRSPIEQTDGTSPHWETAWIDIGGEG